LDKSRKLAGTAFNTKVDAKVKWKAKNNISESGKCGIAACVHRGAEWRSLGTGKCFEVQERILNVEYDLFDRMAGSPDSR